MTTTPCAIRRLELLLARTPDMECADDLRVVLADAVLSRRLLDDARAQKPVAWRPKFDIEGDWSLGEPPIESIEYWHEQGLEIEYAYLRSAPVPAQPSILAPTIEQTNRNLEAAGSWLRVSQAVTVGDSFFESWYSLYNPEGKSTKQTMREAYEAGLIDHEGRADWQPAAVPEAVAKDVSDSALLKAYTTETGKVLPHSWRPIFLDYARIGIKAALLSATDTEGRKDD